MENANCQCKFCFSVGTENQVELCNFPSTLASFPRKKIWNSIPLNKFATGGKWNANSKQNIFYTEIKGGNGILSRNTNTLCKLYMIMSQN